MIVQIYEIQTPQEAEKCIEAGVDHIGSVILSERDWRLPALREAIRVCDGTGVKNSIIPLFRDVDRISRALDYYRPGLVHLCESLTDEQGVSMDLEVYIEAQRKIRERFPEVRITRSIPIPMKGSLSEFPALAIARELEPVSDLFQTDTWLGKGPVEGFIGITGKTCDRKIARELVIRSRIPVILAGGLSPENVYEALIDIRPAGADSCTLTNSLDREGKPIRFKKDFVRVKEFVRETRRAKEILPDKKEQIKREIEDLNELLADRKAALPAHSIRPHQIQAIEELEDEIAAKEKELMGLN
jgi:phosphoribosylanthranilate isomerase